MFSSVHPQKIKVTRLGKNNGTVNSSSLTLSIHRNIFCLFPLENLASFDYINSFYHNFVVVVTVYVVANHSAISRITSCILTPPLSRTLSNRHVVFRCSMMSCPWLNASSMLSHSSKNPSPIQKNIKSSHKISWSSGNIAGYRKQVLMISFERLS